MVVFAYPNERTYVRLGKRRVPLQLFFCKTEQQSYALRSDFQDDLFLSVQADYPNTFIIGSAPNSRDFESFAVIRLPDISTLDSEGMP